MGVNHLWPLLEGASTEIKINELQGQAVAVDLSGWIFESFGVSQVEKITKPHIRTLFYRVAKLLKYGIKPVFVLDGIAPSLKESELLKRKQFRVSSKCQKYGATMEPGSPTRSRSAGRSGYHQETEECCELLDAMGVPHIQAIGEAEATCAMLNQSGLVDACITNDCDVFLYGAKTVYHNFSGLEKETCVTSFSMESIQKECNLDRDSLVAFALLVGCDYTEGVHHVGEVKASNFLSMLNMLKAQCDMSPLDRLKGWRSDTRLDEINRFKQLKKSTHCGLCDHPGNKSTHEKQGCVKCETTIKCNTDSKTCDCVWHQKEKVYEMHKLEISIRNEAIKDTDFPSQKVIDEFLNPRWKQPDKEFWWNRPDIQQVEAYLGSIAKWSKEDVEKKMLPVLTAWDLSNVQQCLSQPSGILRGRTRNKIEMYEVEWDCVEGINSHNLVTEECKEIFAGKFPEMAKQFEDLLKKTKDTPKKWKTQGRSLEQREEALKQNRKITDMFPMKKKTYLKRTDIVRNADSPIISARKKLVFHNTDCMKTPSSATRTSPRKSKRPLRFGDSPVGQPSVKKLFTLQDAASTKTVPN